MLKKLKWNEIIHGVGNLFVVSALLVHSFAD